jgi:hypothetical protein
VAACAVRAPGTLITCVCARARVRAARRRRFWRGFGTFHAGPGVRAACALGHFVVSASDDMTLRVWDAVTGACARVLEGHRDIVMSVCALGADRATLWLIDGATGDIRTRVATLPELPELRVPMGQGVVGHVAATGELVNSRDLAHDPRWADTIAQKIGYHTTSMLTAPIIRRGQIRGVLQVLNKSDGPFTRSDEELMLALSAQAAIAIENARFRKKIIPGNRLDMDAEVKSFSRGLAKGSCAGYVNGELACNTDLVIGIPDILNEFRPKAPGSVLNQSAPGARL